MTEEVWRLARNMTLAHVAAEVIIVFVIGYVALYKAE